MLLVYTDNPNEKLQLEEYCSAKNTYYPLPVERATLLNQLTRSICYQLFQDRPPALATKFQQMIANSLNFTYSLPLYRQIMELIGKRQQSLQQYRTHLVQMNKVFAFGDDGLFRNQQTNYDECDDDLFQKALRGESHKTQTLETIDIQTIEIPLLPITDQLSTICQFESSGEKTMHSDLISSSTIASNNKNQCCESNAKLTNFFYSASAVYTCQDWKTDRSKKDDSKQMNSFKKKGGGVIEANKQLKNLMIDQFRYDVNRQVYLSKNIRKDEQVQTFKYKRMMRQSLLNSKLNLRKKK